MRRSNLTGSLFAAAMLWSACSMAEDLVEDIIDLSRLDVTTSPSGTDVILPAEQRELRVEFSRSVNMREAEELVSLVCPDGHVAYDLDRESRRLVLTPVEPLQAGTRYVLSCRGTISSPGGLIWEVDTECSFFVDTNDEPPVLVSFSPDDEEIVSGEEPVVLRFSSPLNTENPDRHIMMVPDHPVTISARDQDRTLVITPERPWEGLTRYRWSVAETLEGASGVRVPCQYSGTFRTLSDTTAPEKPELSVCPIYPPDGIRLPPEHLANGYGLVFSFNEPVTSESFTRKLTLSPHTTILVRQLTPGEFFVHPESEKWTAGEEYTITIEKGLEDLWGNRTDEAFVFTVTPDMPLPEILRVEADLSVPDGPVFVTGEDMRSGTHVYPVVIDTLTNCPLALTITLSVPLSPKEAQRFVSSVSLEPLFPHYISRPEAGPVLFDPSADSRSIRLNYSGLEVPSRDVDGERVLYTFSIRGGKTGFTTDSGSFFPGTLSVILETFEKEETP